MNKKNRYIRRRGGNYGEFHIHQLVVGHDFFKNAFGQDTEAMRDAWPELREDVFQHMIDRHKRGFTRPLMPFGFWEYESPQGRDKSFTE
ncbi:MAG: hypothetical protein OEV87_11745, partial [Phycisphaerae bacterium]|nr:hypothetical protein [Phycisphaerae bacterium]